MTWRTLTADPEKHAAYADDEWLRSGLAAAREVLGDDVARVVQRHAVLVLQPDCVAGRVAHRCVDLLRRNGFEPVHTVRFHFGPELTAGWDALLVGSAHVEHDRPGVPRLVDRVSVESWLAGEGVLLPPFR